MPEVLRAAWQVPVLAEVGETRISSQGDGRSLTQLLSIAFSHPLYNMHISEALRRSLLENLNRNRWGFVPESSDATVFSSTIMYIS